MHKKSTVTNCQTGRCIIIKTIIKPNKQKKITKSFSSSLCIYFYVGANKNAVYFLGSTGSGATADVRSFDVENATAVWTSLWPMNEPREYHACDVGYFVKKDCHLAGF